ncbi:MAG: class I SAM-dependent methyltransferase [Desulfobacterales bacterium]|nr:class I SAM-dependent methyltransferase [Desulfobacterales bacterium]
MKAGLEEQFCPLCSCRRINSFYEDKNRIYLSCLNCRLVFIPRQFRLGIEDEKAIYDLHKNDSQDQGYRKFLSRLTSPLLEKLDPGQKGLDFGCGPGPTLSIMLEEQGYSVELYDPFYFNDSSIFNKNYDFICATEVIEHLHDPDNDFKNLFKMLKPDGWLGIMTKLVIDADAFSKWHYIRDMTHVCFYSREAFEYIADRFNATFSIIGNDVILFKKN